MRFVSVVILVTLFITHLSCSSDRRDLFPDYARLNCKYQTKLKERDSINQIRAGNKSEFYSAKTGLHKFISVYDSTIRQLDNKIYEVKMEYEEKYAAISKKHEEKHGHFMTPDYEKSIGSLEGWKSKLVRGFEAKIKTLNDKKENDRALKDVKALVDSLQRKVSFDNNAFIRSEAEIKELQIQLKSVDDELNKQYQEISKEEKKSFIERREKLRLHPCSR